MNHCQETLCNKITVKQYLPNGVMAGTYQTTIRLAEGVTASIEQGRKRKVEISSANAVSCEDLFFKFESLDKLLMLFEGRFYPIETLVFESENQSDSGQFADISKELLDKRLSYYHSRDIYQYPILRLLPFHTVLSNEIYIKWNQLLDEMDIVYQTFLYVVSDNGSTVDVNFAFLAELAEPFVELIKENTFYCQSLTPGERGTTLKMCIDSIITHFGTDIFSNELNDHYSDFLDNVVGSRVRIMHIKKNQKKYFDGKDCIRYSKKFSLLYRRILLELLGVPYNMYETSLKKDVIEIDNSKNIKHGV